MRIEKYLYNKRMTVTDLAIKVGVTSQTIRTVHTGTGISFKLAQKIVMATNLEVGLADLLPQQFYAMIAEYKRNES